MAVSKIPSTTPSAELLFHRGGIGTHTVPDLRQYKWIILGIPITAGNANPLGEAVTIPISHFLLTAETPGMGVEFNGIRAFVSAPDSTHITVSQYSTSGAEITAYGVK